MKHTILPANDLVQTVRPVVEEAFKECERVLPSYKEMRVILHYTQDPFVSKQMGGSSGFTHGDTTMEMEVNLDVGTWRKQTKRSVAHEYNHVIWHQIHGKDWQSITLGELIVMEGLAQNFERYHAGGPPVYATYVGEKTLRGVWEKIQDHLDENGKQWWQRLSFEDSDEFPFWSGYSLAYAVLSKRIRELDLSWPELMKIEGRELIRQGLEV